MYEALKETIMIFSTFINFLANFQVLENILEIFSVFYQKLMIFFSSFAKYLKNRTRRNTKPYMFLKLKFMLDKMTPFICLRHLRFLKYKVKIIKLKINFFGTN